MNSQRWIDYKCADAALGAANTACAIAIQSGADAALRARMSAYRDRCQAAYDRARDAYDSAIDDLSLSPE